LYYKQQWKDQFDRIQD